MAISNISLINFRNHIDFNLESASEHTNFIIGPNGAGKTNILEAISLLSPGRGFRSAKATEIYSNHDSKIYPNWAAHFAINQNKYNISFALNNGRESKLIKHNDILLRGSKMLLEQLKIVWLTPQMCHLFAQNSEERRKFLDRIVYNHLPEHAEILTNYKKLVRSRMQLIKQDSYDINWISTLEEQIADNALKIIKNRSNVIEQLKLQLNNYDWNWRPILSLQSCLRDADLESVTSYANMLANNRKRDAIIGRTMFGPHKDDLSFTHSFKKISERLCSTGEQKNAVIKIILAHLAALGDSSNIPIILLLDDIFAHIDNYNKDMMLIALQSSSIVQKWITATPDDLEFAGQKLGLQNSNIIKLA